MFVILFCIDNFGRRKNNNEDELSAKNILKRIKNNNRLVCSSLKYGLNNHKYYHNQCLAEYISIIVIQNIPCFILCNG